MTPFDVTRAPLNTAVPEVALTCVAIFCSGDGIACQRTSGRAGLKGYSKSTSRTQALLFRSPKRFRAHQLDNKDDNLHIHGESIADMFVTWHDSPITSA